MNGPISLIQLHRLVQPTRPKTAFSTIFRHVRALEANGEIVRLDWRERGGQYEAAQLPHHHHLRCRQCQRVVDLVDPKLLFDRRAIESATGFTIERHTIELEGLCATCQSTN